MFDEIKYHKHLCRDIWDSDDKLNGDVRHALFMIVIDYIAWLRWVGFDINNKDIVDIFIHGSLTNYYYDKHSDIDLVIVADLSRFRQKIDIFKQQSPIIKALKHEWAGQFRFDIRGRHIDLSLHDVIPNPFEHGYYDKVGSIYSIAKDKWIIRPVRLSSAELAEIQKSARRRFREICAEMHRVRRENGDVREFIHRLQVVRKTSMDAQYWQPLTAETMAFKMFRNRGFLRRITRRGIQKRSERFNVK